MVRRCNSGYISKKESNDLRNQIKISIFAPRVQESLMRIKKSVIFRANTNIFLYL